MRADMRVATRLLKLAARQTMRHNEPVLLAHVVQEVLDLWAEYLSWTEGLVRNLNGGIGENGLIMWDSPELPLPDSYSGSLTVQVTSTSQQTSSSAKGHRKIVLRCVGCCGAAHHTRNRYRRRGGSEPPRSKLQAELLTQGI